MKSPSPWAYWDRTWCWKLIGESVIRRIQQQVHLIAAGNKSRSIQSPLGLDFWGLSRDNYIGSILSIGSIEMSQCMEGFLLEVAYLCQVIGWIIFLTTSLIFVAPMYIVKKRQRRGEFAYVYKLGVSVSVTIRSHANNLLICHFHF